MLVAEKLHAMVSLGIVETPLGKARRRSTADMTVDEFSALIDTTGEYVVHKYGEPLPAPSEVTA